MSERIDYAEMLEIPVSTVNVVRKKSKKKRAETDDLKDQVVKAVNERVSEGDFSEEKSEEVLSETRYAASEDLSEEYGLEEPDAAPVKVKGKFFDSKILARAVRRRAGARRDHLSYQHFLERERHQYLFRGTFESDRPITVGGRRPYLFAVDHGLGRFRR